MKVWVVIHINHVNPKQDDTKVFASYDKAIAYYNAITEPLEECCTKQIVGRGVAQFWYSSLPTGCLTGSWDSFVKVTSYEVEE